MVRMHSDLADMIGWICRVQGGTAALLIDPLVRPQITARYKQIETVVESIKKLEESVKQKGSLG